MPESSTKPFASLWPTTPNAATDKVLTTYELLEPILLHLPWNQSFTCQRVSRTWHSIIKHSVHIQEKLFRYSPLQPIRSIKPIHRESLHGGYRVLYRAQNFQICPATPASESDWQPHRTHSSKARDTDTDTDTAAASTPQKGGELARWNLTDSGDIWHFSIGLGGTLDADTPPDSTEASWRDMHVASPPLEAVDFDFLPDVPEFSYTLSMWNPKGVRLGELYDWTWRLGRLFEKTTGQKLAGRIAVASFWVFAPK
ncbi:hypothetical protein CERZMDRAFT_103046 [Cercospora zeae-maydis SCOH1-5]|uniref:F-box domain-containing protein n=1 Tax=Cercospora zeae-maydis SCOH1-5 TaxID=717836 RepID=A0A6A6EYF9_9PEZI|nr:hypothetical protein CERZMDRAFT_103046 [Cercospora zeae-maydis SCOH1-5]